MKMHSTPFRVVNGLLCGGDYTPLHLIPADYILPDSEETLRTDLEKFEKDGFNHIELRLDEDRIADSDGHLAKAEGLHLLDLFFAETEMRGFTVGIDPHLRWELKSGITDWRYLPDLRIRYTAKFETYTLELVRRKNTVNGKTFAEMPHIAIWELYPRDTKGMSEIETCGWALFVYPYLKHDLHRPILMIRQCEELHQPGVSLAERLDFTPDPAKLRFNAVLPLPKAEFTARIREHHKNFFHPVATVFTDSNSSFPHENGGCEGWLGFDAACETDLRLDFRFPVKDARFRPSMREFVPVAIQGNGVELTLKTPRYGCLEINYDSPDLPRATVYIFADAMEKALSGNSIRVLEPGFHSRKELEGVSEECFDFAPGLHEFEGGKLHLQSNRTYHLSRGAVLRCGIVAEECEHTAVTGHGVIDASFQERKTGENWQSRGEEGTCFFWQGTDILIDGPVLYDPEFWAVVVAGTAHMTIRNFKILAWVINDDGLQPRSVNDFLAEHCFIKSMDDCVAIKTRRAAGMISRNLMFRDCVLWNDCANGFEIGYTSQADLLENVTFRDSSLILGGRSAFSLHVADHELVHNVLYENIDIEGKAWQNLIDYRLLGEPSSYKSDPVCGNVDGVLFRNIRVENDTCKVNVFGWNEDSMIQNLEACNLQLRKPLEIAANEFTRNIHLENAK